MTRTTLIQYLGLAFRFLRPYWGPQSQEKRFAWTMLILAIGFDFGVIYSSVLINYWQRDFFNALQELDREVLPGLAVYFLGVVSVIIAFVVARIHVGNHLLIRWRRWMTQQYLDGYLGNRMFSQLELKDYGIDNPDQRISMDLFNVAEDTLSLGLAFLQNLSRLGAFSIVLWGVSGSLPLVIFGVDISIPGYMFWIAIVYAVLATMLVHKLNRKMTPLEVERQHVEADFRFSLARLREHSESIALSSGQAREKSLLGTNFSAIFKNWMDLLVYKRRLAGMQSIFNQFNFVLPFMVGVPALFAGTIAIGGLMQLADAFRAVENSLSWFIHAYARLAQWKSSLDRAIALQAALTEARKDNTESGLKVADDNDPGRLSIERLDLDLPDGRPLLRGVNMEIERGRNLLVHGRSGSGKTTLFRAIAGLWLWGEGRIRRPKSKVVFVPQHTYLPFGSFREAVCYPQPGSDVDEDRLAGALTDCALDAYVHRVDEVNNWARVLSGGEQQRVAFVRAILQEPDWLFLDESTSAMDLETEDQIYRALARRLPNATVVSIGHRESIEKFHDTRLTVDPEAMSLKLQAVAGE